MSDPKVTVLMSVYNGEKYLRKAIESILKQTFTDFEFLIINDGSTDYSGEIFRSYSDPRIRFVSNSANRGLTRSLNTGLKLAKGEYVARIDADDVAFQNRLQVQVAFLDAHLDVCLLGGSYEVIDENGVVMSTEQVLADPLSIRFCLLFDNPVCHSSVMFRRSAVLEVGGYDENVRIGQDFDLWNRLVTRGKIVQMDKPLVQLRRHNESVSRTSPIHVKDHYVSTVIRNIHLLTGREIPFEVAKCLYGQSECRAFDQTTIAQAYATIANCLIASIKRCAKGGTDRRLLLFLTLDKLIRLAHQSPNSPWQALWMGLRLTLQHSPDAILSRKFVRFAWRMIVPYGARKRLQTCYPGWLSDG